jgi:tRNA threonylcarbamoyl adenosine modification protein (Sua5/YciO/YrdC/YwlC family)
MSRVLSAGDPSSIDETVAALLRGEVVAIPTETVYGLAVLPTPEGLRRLLAAKQRSPEKGIQLLIDSLEQASAIGVVTDPAARLAEAFWPGGLTIVLRRRDDVPLPELLGRGRATIGVRLPDHEVPRALARRLGPIAASSANISGEPDATTAQRVADSLGNSVVLIVDDGPARGGTPSTVIDCSDEAVAPRILREGAISSDRITAALR